MIKRNRTAQEKIDDCLDNYISNLHPDLREKLFIQMLDRIDLNSSASKMGVFIKKDLSFPGMGSMTYPYWIVRGWSISEAKYKSKSLQKTKTKSPFSIEFWLEKENPETGEKYTEDEAEFKRNSQRPIRKEFWIIKGYSEEEAISLALARKKSNNKSGAKIIKEKTEEEHRSNSHRCIEYWLLRGYTEEEAKEKISEHQATFSKKKCIEKNGEEEGIRIWQERQQKWLKSYKKNNFSKISQELFHSVVKCLDDTSKIYFATFDRDDMKEYGNKELTLSVNNQSIKPDFVCLNRRKIIEFDGDYWHNKGDLQANLKRETLRDNNIIKENFEVFHIKEKCYNNNKQECIEQCIQFLKQ
jgi:hypothetical protein